MAANPTYGSTLNGRRQPGRATVSAAGAQPGRMARWMATPSTTAPSARTCSIEPSRPSPECARTCMKIDDEAATAANTKQYMVRGLITFAPASVIRSTAKPATRANAGSTRCPASCCQPLAGSHNALPMKCQTKVAHPNSTIEMSRPILTRSTADRIAVG